MSDQLRLVLLGKPKFERNSQPLPDLTSVKGQALFRAKYRFNFPLLSDPDHKTIEAYGSWQQKQFMGRKFMGIARSSFLIDKTGKIEAVWPSVKAKGHAAEVLRHLASSPCD